MEKFGDPIFTELLRPRTRVTDRLDVNSPDAVFGARMFAVQCAVPVDQRRRAQQQKLSGKGDAPIVNIIVHPAT